MSEQTIEICRFSRFSTWQEKINCNIWTKVFFISNESTLAAGMGSPFISLVKVLLVKQGIKKAQRDFDLGAKVLWDLDQKNLFSSSSWALDRYF